MYTLLVLNARYIIMYLRVAETNVTLHKQTPYKEIKRMFFQNTLGIAQLYYENKEQIDVGIHLNRSASTLIPHHSASTISINRSFSSNRVSYEIDNESVEKLCCRLFFLVVASCNGCWIAMYHVVSILVW